MTLPPMPHGGVESGFIDDKIFAAANGKTLTISIWESMAAAKA